MNVYLDTNIVINNYFLNTPKFLALFDYLEKTNCTLLISDIVKNEVIQKYNEDVESYTNTLIKYNRTVLPQAQKVDYGNDKDQLKEKYVQFWHSLKNKHVRVLNYEGVSLNTVIKKALDKRHPFDNKGRGFKDAVIWLTLLDQIRNFKKDETICFISANSKDFGTNVLHPLLLEDLGAHKDDVFYFNSLEDFLSEYAEQINFINRAFIEEFISDVKNTFNEDINEADIDIADLDFFDHGSVDDGEITDIEIDDVELENFYIYSSTVDSYRVEASINIGIIVHAQVEVEDYDEESGTQIENDHASMYVSRTLDLTIDKKTQSITNFSVSSF